MRLNGSRSVHIRIFLGKAFHSFGPAIEKHLSPYDFIRDRGTTSNLPSDDLRLFDGLQNDDIVKDEIHFLCQCTKYAENRNNLYAQAAHLDPYFYSLDDIDKFVFLMSNLQKPVIRFIYNAINIRTNLLTISENSQIKSVNGPLFHFL